MINIQTLSSDDKSVRTQITLTEQLKLLVEEMARQNGESLSEYLRKAAVIRLLVEETEKENLASLAKKVIGSINLDNHPEWKNKNDVYKWVRNLREEK